ncbi:GNAT family N-acetyltransferase [Aeromicrobium terrae]|uniref:GNAT family N-acetyltransferase n=1 Tax=Aeromicrobium terrae TaxID=2498846 RepID=A0A5C8NKJ1_9ACTN|nr:GNAT family N-acetyltransferase [Aeromicrobium terrae]TXL61385.1 GNAT family N-acetyltransferase [Aeromicrobium terrae]
MTTYTFGIRGHLDDHWAAWLGDLRVTRSADGTSTLTGPVRDQAHLHGILGGLRDIGAELCSLNVVEDVAPTLPHPVRTKRLTLRAARPDDADAIWQYRRLPEVGAWLTEIPTDLDAYRATFTDPGRLATTVIVELDGTIIGDFMLRVDDAWAQAEVRDQARGTQAELGSVLDPAFHGHGYATEAMRALLRVCFDDLGVRRVTANAFLANEASCRLMERLGMRREHHAVAESLHRSGAWLDTVDYALLSHEFTHHTKE